MELKIGWTSISITQNRSCGLRLFTFCSVFTSISLFYFTILCIGTQYIYYHYWMRITLKQIMLYYNLIHFSCSFMILWMWTTILYALACAAMTTAPFISMLLPPSIGTNLFIQSTPSPVSSDILTNRIFVLMILRSIIPLHCLYIEYTIDIYAPCQLTDFAFSASSTPIMPMTDPLDDKLEHICVI